MYSEGQSDGRLVLMKMALGGMLRKENFPKIKDYATEMKAKEQNEYGQGYHDVIMAYMEEFENA